MLGYSLMRNEEFENEEFLERKTDENNEKMRDKNQAVWKLFEKEMIENSKYFFPIQPSQP